LVHLESKKHSRNYRLELPSPEESKHSRLVVMYGYELKPMRLLFETTSLLEMLHDMGHNFAETSQYSQSEAKIKALVDDIFPAVTKVWAGALLMYQASQNIVPLTPVCGNYTVPANHLDEGVSNADVVIYVAVRDRSLCLNDSKPSIDICHFDQNMRPLIGTLSICLDSMGLQNNRVNKNEMLWHIASNKALVGKFLGLSPSLFRYFRDPSTQENWGGRYVKIFCDDNGEKEVYLSNVIQEQTSSEGERYYEISTPTVRQVVRNHFDCQSMTGARLNAPMLDNNDTCIFSNLDIRYHFDEDMTSLSPNVDSAFSLSPLSLAILEDSSWYKANFTAATTPSFGRAAGCGFVYESCIAKGKVPDYSSGYFCNTSDETRTGCDFNHRNKAGCDLQRYAKPPLKFQYFHPENPEFGSIYEDVDYCPMRSKHLASCSSAGTRMPSQFQEEFFDDSSRCYETDAGAPICLETICNPQDQSLNFIVEGKSFICRYHGETIDVGLDYSIVCPRLAAICPDLVCPSDCSGHGICDYCQEVPTCICDNPFDKSPGCWDS
jgi:leishmanolysin-like peptidase